MKKSIPWSVAGTTIGLGLLVGVLGCVAAWNIHLQQRSTADMLTREVHSLAKVSELQTQVREVRYQLNRFLRKRDLSSVGSIRAMQTRVNQDWQNAIRLAATEHELHLLRESHSAYSSIIMELKDSNWDSPNLERLTALADEVLTDEVLQPLEACIAENEKVVDITNELGKRTSKQLATGLLLMGVTGAGIGIAAGLTIARAIGRGMVQLNVSIRSAATRLQEIRDQVCITHVGDIGGLESSLKSLELNIEHVVESMQAKNLELVRSEQLARVGQLAAGLAHEIRNPLMPLKMLIQSAMQPGKDGKLSPRSLQVISDEILRLESIVQEFLDYAKPRALSLQTVDMVAVIRDWISFIQPHAQESGITIDAKLTDQPLTATIDVNQLKQLFINLANNAFDAMKEGGTFSVTLTRNADEIMIDPTTLDDIGGNDSQSRFRGGYFILAIEDTGPGIPTELESRIFDPFVTDKETGTGLGLSICRQIAESHKGVLLGRNRIDRKGAQFCLMLPTESWNAPSA